MERNSDLSKKQIREELSEKMEKIANDYSKKYGINKRIAYAAMSAVLFSMAGGIAKEKLSKVNKSEDSQTQVYEEINDLGLPNKESTENIGSLRQDEVYYMQQLSPNVVELIGKIEPNSLIHYEEPKIASVNNSDITAYYKYYVKEDGEGFVNFRSEPTISDNNVIDKLKNEDVVYLEKEPILNGTYGFRSAIHIKEDGTIEKGYFSPATYDENDKIIERTIRARKDATQSELAPNIIVVPKKNIELCNKNEKEIEKNIVTFDEGIDFRQDFPVTEEYRTIFMKTEKENKEGNFPVVAKIPKGQEIDIYALAPELEGSNDSIWKPCTINYNGEQIEGFALVGKKSREEEITRFERSPGWYDPSWEEQGYIIESHTHTNPLDGVVTEHIFVRKHIPGESYVTPVNELTKEQNKAR